MRGLDENYRLGVVAVVVDQRQRVLLVQQQSYRDGEWKFPGGGVEEGESAMDAISRELREELGTDSFSIVKECKAEYLYDWTEGAIASAFKKTGKLYRGQRVKQFLVKFNGDPNKIAIDKNEIKKYLWVQIEELDKYLIFPGQLQNAQKVIREFGI